MARDVLNDPTQDPYNPVLDDPTRFETTTAAPDESGLPPERRNRPPGAGPGRWLGNQWILDAINYPPPGAPPGVPGHFENEVWVVDPVPMTSTGSTTMGPTTPAAAPPAAGPSSDGGGGGGGGSTHTDTSSVSSVYQNMMQQLLSGGAPSSSGGSVGAAPVRPTSTLVAPPVPGTVAGPTLNLPPKSEFDQMVHDQILKLLGGPTAEEAGRAASTSEPVNAYRQSVMRDLEKSRAGAAEMAGLTGTDASGGMAGTIQGLKQAAGESTAKFTGEYVERAMAARRQELQQALTMAQQQGNFEDTQALQAEIARIDNQLRAQQNATQLYGTQVQQYLGQLGNEENMYGHDISLYGTQLDADIRRQQNANTLYGIEVNKVLGMSDQELRRYIADNQYAAQMAATSQQRDDSNARIDLGYAQLAQNQTQYDADYALKLPKV